MNSIKIIYNSEAGRLEKVFSQEKITIGRNKDNDIYFEGDMCVSGLHAEIRRIKQEYYLIDAVSKNGTILNDIYIDKKKEILLFPKDKIKINNYNLEIDIIEQPKAMEDTIQSTIKQKYTDIKTEVNQLALSLRKIFVEKQELDRNERRKKMSEVVFTHLKDISNDQHEELIYKVMTVFNNKENSENIDEWKDIKKGQIAFESIEKMAILFLKKDKPFQNGDDINKFCKRFINIMEILLKNYSEILKEYWNTLESLGVERVKINIKEAIIQENIKEYLLNWKATNLKDLKNELDKEHKKIISHFPATLRSFEKCINNLLLAISPETLEQEVFERNKIYLVKRFFNLFSPVNILNTWNLYVEKHEDILENQNMAFNTILNDFKHFYISFLNENKAKGLKNEV